MLGEQAPKIFAIRHPEELSLWCAAPMRVYYVLCYPLLRALDVATAAVLRLVGVRRLAGHEIPHSQEELRALIRQSRAHGELSPTEHRLVEAAFEFDDTICRKIMVPRNEVVFLNVRDAVEQSLRIAKENLHTRYPVCDESLDEVSAKLRDLKPEDFLMVVSGDLTNEGLYTAQKFVRTCLDSNSIDSTARQSLSNRAGIGRRACRPPL